MIQQHFCSQHQTKFFKNEKKDAAGNTKVWYSHKIADGSGFCVEKDPERYYNDITPAVRSNRSVSQTGTNLSTIFACNAMNNAIALANAGKIELDQIEGYFNKILTTLSQ